MHITQLELTAMDRVQRLKIVNALSGIKPANLIGTISKDTGANLSIFNSVMHIGSDPALIGFIVRPLGEVERNTYTNIKENGYYTINHIHEDFIEKAHYTSAKFSASTSEFETCHLTEEYLGDFIAPFVGESKLKFGVKFVEEIPIPSNNTLLIIGEIQELTLPEQCIDENGYIRLDHLSNVGISGLNSYYNLKFIESFPYARVSEVPSFE